VDFRLYARVLWRFRLLVACGFLLALVLATLSIVRVSADGLAYRQTELFSSTARVGVTQSGFPWGRLFAQEPETEDSQPQDLGIPVADPNRLNNLAVLYAELAMSDPVRRLVRAQGPLRGQIIATPLVRGDNRIMLPLIDLTAIAETRRGAMVLASRTARALETHVREQQAANEVPPADRVVIEEVMRPKGALVYQPRSKTMPIVVFLAVMLATSGIAFLLENVRPRSRAPGAASGLRERERRSA
jgi:hypothetical protein